MPFRRVLSGVILVVALAFTGVAFAQNVGGSIQGLVTDASGAAVPGVTVVIRNIATGDVRELVTDSAGR